MKPKRTFRLKTDYYFLKAGSILSERWEDGDYSISSPILYYPRPFTRLDLYIASDVVETRNDVFEEITSKEKTEFEFSINYNNLRVKPKLTKVSLANYSVEDLIQLSIMKWKKVVEEYNTVSPIYDGADKTCALCTRFNQYPDDTNNCLECPIYKITGKVQCANTPYHFHRVNRCIEHARSELKFLKDLLVLYRRKK